MLAILLHFVLAAAPTENPTAEATPVSYSALLAEIAEEQQRLQALYKRPKADRAAIIKEARQYVLRRLVEDIFPAWYGTVWEFYGTTEVPGQGGVACGYFAFTALRDIGFRLPHAQLAQLYSENAIKNLAPVGQIKRFRNASMAEIEEHFASSGHGLYLAGLDCHVGFVVYDDDGGRFVHSSYYNPPLAVVSEPLDGPNPFRDSKYRVIGKLFDDAMMKRWLGGEKFALTYGVRRKAQRAD